MNKLDKSNLFLRIGIFLFIIYIQIFVYCYNIKMYHSNPTGFVNHCHGIPVEYLSNFEDFRVNGNEFSENFIPNQEHLEGVHKRLDRAVIVEPREHIALEEVLRNIVNKMNIPITIVHGINNKEFVENIAAKIPQVDIMTEINAENLDAGTYSQLLMDLEFWENIGVNENDHILIFQTDSGICGEGLDIHNYSQYDYCGAPWESPQMPVKVGNGGFSIRSVAHAKKHIRNHDPSKTWRQNEDGVFAKWCDEDSTCKVCPLGAARKFASETYPDKSAAFHNNWKYHNVSSCSFNQKIKKLNKQQPSVDWSPPNVRWVPTFHMRWKLFRQSVV